MICRCFALMCIVLTSAACTERVSTTPSGPGQNTTPVGPSANSCQRTVSVSSQEAWQDSGCDVISGDRISISASGTIRFDSSGASASPVGSGRAGFATTSTAGCNFLLCWTSIPQHSLVGRVGSNSLLDSTTGFFVGTSYAEVSSRSGRLYLGFNAASSVQIEAASIPAALRTTAGVSV